MLVHVHVVDCPPGSIKVESLDLKGHYSLILQTDLILVSKKFINIVQRIYCANAKKNINNLF